MKVNYDNCDINDTSFYKIAKIIIEYFIFNISSCTTESHPPLK